MISRFDIEQITTEALLFQSGYLTIRQQETLASGMTHYNLAYPNLEVEFALNTCLLNAYTNDASTNDQLRTRLYDLLQAGDIPAMRELFRTFFAGSPDRRIAGSPDRRIAGSPDRRIAGSPDRRTAASCTSGLSITRLCNTKATTPACFTATLPHSGLICG